MQRLKPIEYEQRPPFSDELGQPPAFVERALRVACHRRVAEEDECFLEKRIGRGRGLVARALAVEGPRKGGLATRPVFSCKARQPLGHQRRLPLAPEPEEGEDVRAVRLGNANLRPGIGDNFSFVFAPNEFSRGMLDDAGDIEFWRLTGCGRDPLAQQPDEGFAGQGSGLGGVNLQFCDKGFGGEEVVSAGMRFESGYATEHGYALGRFIKDASNVRVLLFNRNSPYLVDMLQAQMEMANEHQAALFGRARCFQLPGPSLHVGFLEEVGRGFDLGGVGACTVLPHKVELLIAESGFERDLRNERVNLHKIEQSDQRLDKEAPNGDRAAASSEWFLHRGRHDGVAGAGFVVLKGEALSSAARVARLASACRSPCTPRWSWRSLLRPLLIVTARAIPSRGRPDKADSLLHHATRDRGAQLVAGLLRVRFCMRRGLRG